MKNKNFIIFSIVSVVFVFTLFIVSYISSSKISYIEISKRVLFEKATSLFNNIVNTREWASRHGGVYIKAHEGIEPNPYLTDNYTYTKDNELLIKVNPAWMTRQISELSNKKEKYYFRITSLQPVNPNNIADKFEKRALTYLENNQNEKFYSSIEKDKYHLLGTLLVKKSCLSCHQSQGYKEGDIIGGLRVSIPVDTYNENVQLITSKTDLLYLITFITSIIFISIFTFTVQSIYNREKNILKLNKTLERKVRSRTKELSIANEQLTQISMQDYLTNIPNRRYFFKVGSQSFNVAKRERFNLSLLCIDIDFFKKVNDTYGHQIGDEILKLVSSTMNKQIRKADILARTGGEEFVILLHNVDSNGAFILAEKIREIISKTPYTKRKLEINTTVSIGISELNDEDKDLDTLMAKADEALYISKQEGRNCTTIYKTT